MSRVDYVVDTSVLTRLAKPPVTAVFAPLALAGRVAICSPVAFELGYSARNQADHAALSERLAAFPAVPVTDADHRRTLEVQHRLASSGRHRAVSLVDALVAAAAEARGLSVLHYDADFELIAGVTGQAHRWVVTRGTAD
jgi:predicted nucleic acid-binding protein